jgi:hypothetical protein
MSFHRYQSIFIIIVNVFIINILKSQSSSNNKNIYFRRLILYLFIEYVSFETIK